jgi:tetratricopeptide (TPR) repeat protein
MTEIWDLARFVEDHPDDRDQRWRLAKKLYTAWEYRLALEHLQVLKNEWPQKINVRRYLAATYYRLGRYEDAIEELHGSLESWPGEIGLHEQLARVLEIAGKREEAAAAWDHIADLDPHHPIARNAAKRLQEKIQKDARDDLRLNDSDSGIDLSPGQVCPNCGAQNSDEFERCWQCHAVLLAGHESPHATPRPVRKPARVGQETAALVMGLGALGLISLGFILSIQLFFGDAGPQAPTHTLYQFFTHDLAVTRVCVGVSLLLIWPCALWIALSLIQYEERIPAALINLTGLLCAALAFCATWLPPHLLSLALVLPLALALFLIAGTFRLGLPKTLVVWAAHVTGVFVLGLLLVVLVEAWQTKRLFNPITEASAVLAYAAAQRENEVPGSYQIASVEAPYTQKLRWRATGSEWLDTRASRVLIAVQIDTLTTDVKFELRDNTGTRVYEFLRGPAWSMEYAFEPGIDYEIVVNAPQGTQVLVTLSGLLVPEFQS